MFLTKKISRNFAIFLLIYLLLNLGLRLMVSDSLENDEAEQILFSQQLSLGYNSQPPLYNWIQLAFFKMFGFNIFALAFLKNLLIYGLYFSFYKFAQKALNDDRYALLSAASLFLVYQFHWLILKGLSHTILLLFIASLTLYLVLRLKDTQSLLLYFTLGLVLGLGFLTKYNYLLFVLALFLSALTIKDFRKKLISRPIFISGFVFLMVISPHCFWLIKNHEIACLGLSRFEIVSTAYRIPLTGIYLLFRSIAQFLLPLIVVYCLCFYPAFKQTARLTKNDPDEKLLLERFFLISLGLSILMIIIFRISFVEPRWLSPFLFVFPVYFFMRINTANLFRLRFKFFLIVALTAAVLTLIIIPGRIFFAEKRGKFNRLNYPLRDISLLIKSEGFKKGLIITQNYAIAGDLKLYFKDSVVVTPDNLFQSEISEEFPQVLLAWEPDRKKIFFYEVRPFDSAYNLDINQKPIFFKEAFYKYSKRQFYRINYILINQPIKKVHSLEGFKG